jgi:hypothetical protein
VPSAGSGGAVDEPHIGPSDSDVNNVWRRTSRPDVACSPKAAGNRKQRNSSAKLSQALRRLGGRCRRVRIPEARRRRHQIRSPASLFNPVEQISCPSASISHFKELASYERRSCDPDRGRASSPAVLRKRLAPSRVSGGVDGRFICRSGFWSQQARFTFLSLSKPLPVRARLPRPTGRLQEEGEREVVSSRAGARARQAHRLTPDTLPLEAEAIPRGTPSRA